MHPWSSIQFPSPTPYESGAGAGGSGSGSMSSPGSGSGTGSGSGAADGGTSGRGTGSGSGSTGGGGTAYKLSDDALVDLGDGKPVKWGEARGSRYVPKEDHERYVQTFQSARPMLESYARQLDEGFARLRQAEQVAQRGGQQGRPAQRDITEEIAELPILDGAAGARMIKALREQGLAPIAQMLTTQQGQIQQLSQALNQVRGATGQVYARHQDQDFEAHVTDNLKELGEIKGIGTIDTSNPTVRELMKDLWGAYDAKTWTIPEYRRMAKDRIEGFVQLVLDAQRKQVERAKEQRRSFFNPNRGGGTPSGQPSYRHMDGLALARESGIFDRSNAA